MSRPLDELAASEAVATELLGTGAALDALAEAASEGAFMPDANTWALFTMLAAECKRGHDAIQHLVSLLMEEKKAHAS